MIIKQLRILKIYKGYKGQRWRPIYIKHCIRGISSGSRNFAGGGVRNIFLWFFVNRKPFAQSPAPTARVSLFPDTIRCTCWWSIDDNCYADSNVYCFVRIYITLLGNDHIWNVNKDVLCRLRILTSSTSTFLVGRCCVILWLCTIKTKNNLIWINWL